MPKNVSLSVKCTKCNHTLMDYKKMLNGKPSILVDIKCKEEKGKLWLCSTYGCYDKEADIQLPEGCKVDIFCPHCHELLNTSLDCKECDGKVVKFNIDIGGVVSICSKVGCQSHYIMIENLEDTLRKFHRTYGV